MRHISLMIFLILFCLSACAVKKTESTSFDVGTTAEQPVSTAVPLNQPAEGLVRIQVRLGQGSLKYAITDIGFQKYWSASDGDVYIDITTGHHMVNACNSSGKFAVENNTVMFPLYVNGTQLTRIRKDPNGGMFYLYIWPDGRVSADPP